jgi:hypothetical protein
MNIDLSANACLSKWGTTRGASTLSRYFWPVRPKCQNIDELKTAILQEWQQFPQERLRRLVRSMTKRVTELHNKRGGYTRYFFLTFLKRLHQGL